MNQRRDTSLSTISRPSRSRITSSLINTNSNPNKSKSEQPPCYTYCVSAFETCLDGGSNSCPFGTFNDDTYTVDDFILPSPALRATSRRRRSLESHNTRPSISTSASTSRSSSPSPHRQPLIIATLTPSHASLSVYFVPGDAGRVFLLPPYQKTAPVKSIEKTKNILKSILKWAENSRQYNM